MYAHLREDIWTIWPIAIFDLDVHAADVQISFILGKDTATDGLEDGKRGLRGCPERPWTHTIIDEGSPVHPAIDCYISACSTRLKWSYSSVTLNPSLRPRIFASHLHVLLSIPLEQQW